jgi:diacylglycerol kinase (ATP)
MRDTSEVRGDPSQATMRAAPRRRSGSASLTASFSFAIAGVVETAGRDRNMRIHLAAGVLASCFAALAPLAPVERALLLLCVALVVSAEAANSAIEAVVDLVSPGFDPRARVAKDAAAGAVLALSCGAVAVFLSVALPARPLALVRALPLESAAALVAAAATGVLPVPALRRAAAAAVALVAAGCLAALATRTRSPGALAIAALLLTVAAESARRRHGPRAGAAREGRALDCRSDDRW